MPRTLQHRHAQRHPDEVVCVGGQGSAAHSDQTHVGAH